MTFSLFKEVIMMKKLALVAAGILCTGLLGACSNQGMATSNKGMSQQTAKAGARQPSGKKVKEFSLQGVDGKTYRLSDYKGKKVYLKFWASWCSICLSTLEDTNELAKSEILLHWPMKILCKDDCKGLCSKCGADLNYEECGCDRTVLDPRMAAIQDIFNKFKEV